MRGGQFVATAVLALATTAATPPDQTVPFSFRRLGVEAGLAAITTFGGKATNRYLLETTGSGVAMFDYDGDGRQRSVLRERHDARRAFRPVRSLARISIAIADGGTSTT